MTQTETRSLNAIAADIIRHWKPVYFAASPYVEAMLYMNTLDDKYGAETGKGVVQYFLSNCATWRGEDARRIKAELRSMVK